MCHNINTIIQGTFAYPHIEHHQQPGIIWNLHSHRVIMLHFQQYSDQAEIKTWNMSDEYCIAIIYTTKTHSSDKKTELYELCANVIWTTERMWC
jgi:hypothetical protein